MEEITTCLLAARIVPRFIVRSAYPVPVARFLFFQRGNKAKLINS